MHSTLHFRGQTADISDQRFFSLCVICGNSNLTWSPGQGNHNLQFQKYTGCVFGFILTKPGKTLFMQAILGCIWFYFSLSPSCRYFSLSFANLQVTEINSPFSIAPVYLVGKLQYQQSQCLPLFLLPTPRTKKPRMYDCPGLVLHSIATRIRTSTRI